ncbi:YfiT family bacillithiol transferase [Salinicoccus bachuensis]|uniref:YfiT family bacillithiol transferase n=1 Tax=Salinicoccus bachuensis TaxID=3136731 RepID=A0ABZ3CJE4_9STAP
MDVKFPIGELDVPEKPNLNNVQEWADQIESYTERLRETVDGLSEEDLTRTYREGSWTVRQLVHHIADSQLNMYQRLKLALTADAPKVPGFVQDEWAIQPDTELPVEASIRMLEGMNARITEVARNLTDAQLDRYFIHETNGKITVATKVAKLAWHEEHHLEHIKIALSK